MKKSFVFHPILFAIFPILFLFSYNIKEMLFIEIIRSAVIVVCLSFLLWLLLSLVIKNIRKAAIITSIFSVLFFSYGHASDFFILVTSFIHGQDFSLEKAHMYHSLVWLLIFTISFFQVIKIHTKLHNITNYLNKVSIFLIAIPMVIIGFYSFGRDYDFIKETETEINVGKVDVDNAPDIYYIILDGYARGDILRELYHYDNTEFLDNLVEKGFYVANKSRCNYVQTALSLASSLNFTYLNDLVIQIGAESDDRRPLQNMIQNNRVVEFLKGQGYLFAAFSTGTYDRAIKGDIDIEMNHKLFLGEFEKLLINTTPLTSYLPFSSLKIFRKVAFQCDLYNSHRERLLYVFEHIPDMAKLKGKVFVFTHILAPHPPFVFGRDGERIKSNRKFTFSDGIASIEKEVYMQQYINQIIFINKKIESVIDQILASSPEPPIIVLQADHGSGLYWGGADEVEVKERQSIFNAYYFPNGGHRELYEDITPVNTFRILFNYYFDADLELLGDKSYFSTWEQPYKFIES